MTRRSWPPRLRVDVVTDHTAEIRGTGDFRVLDRLGCPKLYAYRPPSGGGPCWIVPARLAPDVAAMAEHLGGQADIDRQTTIA